MRPKAQPRRAPDDVSTLGSLTDLQRRAVAALLAAQEAAERAKAAERAA